MSISVKNIALSVNGTPSNQFNIELDGAKYTLDNFKITQKLLEPCRLEFVLRKAPEEDINEIQFTTCSSIIGKDVTLRFPGFQLDHKMLTLNLRASSSMQKRLARSRNMPSKSSPKPRIP